MWLYYSEIGKIITELLKKSCAEMVDRDHAWKKIIYLCHTAKPYLQVPYYFVVYLNLNANCFKMSFTLLCFCVKGCLKAAGLRIGDLGDRVQCALACWMCFHSLQQCGAANTAPSSDQEPAARSSSSTVSPVIVGLTSSAILLLC